MSTLATISKQDFDYIENSLKILSDNMSSVATDVVDINGQISGFQKQVENIQDNVKSLEEEIREFMFEIKGSSVVSNAQNEVLISESKLNKKFGHYDAVRRKISGVLGSIDINSIKKSTLITQSEESVLNTPNYYLSYALVALCSWFRNDKKTAYKAINQAIKLNDSKTSLLFCLIHLRLNRDKTALKWLKRYLSTQDPRQMDSEIINVLDALVNNAYNMKMTDEILNHIDLWSKQISSDESLNRAQIDRWSNIFKSSVEEISDNEYPYIANYTNRFEKIKILLANSYTYYNVYNDFLDIMEDVNDSSSKSIDNLLNDLLFSYESSEISLRKEILKNKLIIQHKGDIDKANKAFTDSQTSLNGKNDFKTELTNVILERRDVSSETKKLAVSYSKNIIKTAFFESLSDSKNEIDNITIKINEWSGTTKDGINERELQESLTQYVKHPFESEMTKLKYLNAKTIYCALFAIIGIIALFFDVIIGVAIIIVSLIASFLFMKETVNTKEDLIKNYNETLEKYLFELNNVIAEIVDANYIIKNNNKDKESFIRFIDSFNKENFISRK